jgi:hypothetical protein
LSRKFYLTRDWLKEIDRQRQDLAKFDLKPVTPSPRTLANREFLKSLKSKYASITVDPETLRLTEEIVREAQTKKRKHFHTDR